MHERDSMCCFLDCMFCMSRRVGGGSGLFFFDSSGTEFRALDKRKKRQETSREGEQSEHRVWKHAKGTSKQASTLVVPFFTFFLSENSNSKSR
jgi:hypothetical protein